MLLCHTGVGGVKIKMSRGFFSYSNYNYQKFSQVFFLIFLDGCFIQIAFFFNYLSVVLN